MNETCCRLLGHRHGSSIASAAVATDSSLRDLRHLPWTSIDNDDSLDLDQLSVAEQLAGHKRSATSRSSDRVGKVSTLMDFLIANCRTAPKIALASGQASGREIVQGGSGDYFSVACHDIEQFAVDRFAEE